jgi:thiol-disulfide isomerase/thioredoxin
MRAALLPVLLLVTSCATVAVAPVATPEGPLPFIEDDAPRAFALAKERDLPLFVDAWAPWCHSCRSLREIVLKDPALARHAGRFIWLSVDTEREANAAFVQRYPVENWPTLFVLAPGTGQPVLTWLGGATVPQLERLFDDAERALRAPGEGLERMLAEADRAAAAGDKAGAAERLEQLLREAPADWPRRGRALESLTFAHYGTRQFERCAGAVSAQAPGLARGPSFANAVAMGLSCATSAPPEAPWRSTAITALEPLAREAVALPGLLADDRSGLYEILCDLRSEAQDEAGARACAGDWLSFLESEAAHAPSPAARAVFDAHRVLAALALGAPARAIPALESSERDLPADYNAPARLALLHRAAGDCAASLAASDRALKTVYGPRRLGVLEQKAKTLHGCKDAEQARAVLRQVKAEGEALSPRPPQVTRLLERVEKALAEGR